MIYPEINIANIKRYRNCFFNCAIKIKSKCNFVEPNMRRGHDPLKRVSHIHIKQKVEAIKLYFFGKKHNKRIEIAAKLEKENTTTDINRGAYDEKRRLSPERRRENAQWKERGQIYSVKMDILVLNQ